jgi:hypothetical protein
MQEVGHGAMLLAMPQTFLTFFNAPDIPQLVALN